MPRDFAAAEGEQLVTEAHRMLQEMVQTHQPESVGVAFNGGKDSMATVQLLTDAVGAAVVRRMVFFVFDSPDEFDELVAFRSAEAAKLGVELVVVPGPPREALWRLHRERGLEAAVVGMRRADPSGAWLKSNVTRCTAGWPPMTLYLPVLEWAVPQIWAYTLARGISFCCLYRQGFTSLGPRHETVPNPALRDPERPGSFRPAWELRDDGLERASRGSSGAPSVLSTPTHAACASVDPAGASPPIDARISPSSAAETSRGAHDSKPVASPPTTPSVATDAVSDEADGTGGGGVPGGSGASSRL